MVISSNRKLQSPLSKTYECTQPGFVAEEDRISTYLLHTGGNYLPVKEDLLQRKIEYQRTCYIQKEITYQSKEQLHPIEPL